MSVGYSVARQLFGVATIFVVAGDGHIKYRKFARNDLAPDAKRS
jgi:hypothetical protein